MNLRRGYATSAIPPTPPTPAPSTTSSPSSVQDLPTKTPESVKSEPGSEAWRSYQPDPVPAIVKPLSSILNLEKASQLSSEELGKLWKAYFSRKEGTLFAVVPSEVYSKMMKRGKQYSLRQLKATPSAPAVPYLTLTHYPDLYHSHGIALMKGEVDQAACERDGVALNADDARVLAWGVQQFYATGGTRKLRLVEIFHKDPAGFNYQDVVDEMDRLE
ncbi:ATP synthase mitochondrial F1 complex assembly factor 1 [Gonapodya sp. JEL0774]|nr:ATP synthase mitochondrial F1 complex assembly factor 1 [Gonapodya sp. JEL0774]